MLFQEGSGNVGSQFGDQSGIGENAISIPTKLNSSPSSDLFSVLRPIEGNKSISIAEKVGFSPQFGERIMELNLSLKDHAPRVRSASMILVPGDPPIFSESIIYEGYHMKFWMTPSEKTRASLKIESGTSRIDTGSFFPADTSFEAGGFGFLFSDIVSFTKDAFPNEGVLFRLKSLNPNIEHNDVLIEEPIENISQSFVDSLMDEREVNVCNDEGEMVTEKYQPFDICEILLEGQEEPLLSTRLWFFYDQKGVNRTVYFPLDTLFVEGEASKVEGSMLYIARLFDKPRMYPYSLVHPK